MVVGASHYCSPGKKPEEPINTEEKKRDLERYERISNCKFRKKCLQNSADTTIKCPDPENGDPQNPNNTVTTKYVINYLFNQGPTIPDNYLRTFNYFQSAFADEYVKDQQSRKDFWNSVIFYNYYQDFRSEATSGKFDWDRAINHFFIPFANTIDEFKPDIFFFWGSQVASVMREKASLTEKEENIYVSSIGAVHPIVVFVQHPSQGFSYNGWHEYVVKALKIAQQNKDK